MKTKILIVEDESIIALNIKEILTNFGYEISGIAPNGEKALLLASTKSPDLVLMDITLQNREDGIGVAEQISKICTVPIIFLTANDKNKTIDRAINIKPYGYILKPFKEIELKTTIEIALKKFAENQKLTSKIIEIKSENVSLQSKINIDEQKKQRFIKLSHGYIYDNENFVLLFNGEAFELNDKENKLLKLLIKNIGRVVSVEQIEDFVWDGELVGEGALRSLMFRIRQKLPKDFITCHSKIGYKILPLQNSDV
ncbi:response regulator transcription factor [Sulfuricurvum sp.]|uniref:response regulator transcription factor n=1 Tax=Sulfuricurvum sp. TaxID=2025608 RepID=UPI002E323F0C|nr:response regulator [Sulfuricurvum sp.]HEX5329188.1 response regulator [Sulfuricurvum sp.]